MLQGFGCEQVGFMDNFDDCFVLLGFTHRGRQVLIGVGSRRRSASQAIDLPSDGGGNLGRLFTARD
jgi:hypothetical protein